MFHRHHLHSHCLSLPSRHCVFKVVTSSPPVHFIIARPLAARLAVTRHLHNFVHMLFSSPHHLSLLIAWSFSAFHHDFLHCRSVPSLSSPFSVCRLIGRSLRGCVEMVSRDSSSAQIFSFYYCLSFSIVAFISFASFIYHGHSGAEAPFSFFLYKALPYCLVPQPSFSR
jgi:hypothetical protein